MNNQQLYILIGISIFALICIVIYYYVKNKKENFSAVANITTQRPTTQRPTTQRPTTQRPTTLLPIIYFPTTSNRALIIAPTLPAITNSEELSNWWDNISPTPDVSEWPSINDSQDTILAFTTKYLKDTHAQQKDVAQTDILIVDITSFFGITSVDNCHKCGALWYPVCRNGYDEDGCNLCKGCDNNQNEFSWSGGKCKRCLDGFVAQSDSNKICVLNAMDSIPSDYKPIDSTSNNTLINTTKDTPEYRKIDTPEGWTLVERTRAQISSITTQDKYYMIACTNGKTGNALKYYVWQNPDGIISPVQYIRGLTNGVLAGTAYYIQDTPAGMTRISKSGIGSLFTDTVYKKLFAVPGSTDTYLVNKFGTGANDWTYINYFNAYNEAKVRDKNVYGNGWGYTSQNDCKQSLDKCKHINFSLGKPNVRSCPDGTNERDLSGIGVNSCVSDFYFRPIAGSMGRYSVDETKTLARTKYMKQGIARRYFTKEST